MNVQIMFNYFSPNIRTKIDSLFNPEYFQNMNTLLIRLTMSIKFKFDIISGFIM